MAERDETFVVHGEERHREELQGEERQSEGVQGSESDDLGANVSAFELSASEDTDSQEVSLSGERNSSPESENDEQADDSSDSTLAPLATQIAAILFSTSRPLTSDQLSRITEASVEMVEEALAEVRGMFSGNVHGFELINAAGGVQFRTAPELSPVLRRMLPIKTRRLSKAAAETLAVVAYRQPVQRAEIESIRGVDALPTLKTLLDQKLVRVVGHDSAIGQPTLYGTTEYFLERFALGSLSDLPTERELLSFEDEPGELFFDQSDGVQNPVDGRQDDVESEPIAEAV